MTNIALMFSDRGYDIPTIKQALSDCDVAHCPDWRSWNEDELADRCREFDAIVTGRGSPRLPDSLIGNRGRLQLMAHCHGSVKAYVSKRHLQDGLHVSNWGDAVSGVAESAFCLVLACMKQLHRLNNFIRSDWKNDQRIALHYPATLLGRDVGLYGFGPIGRHMARMLQPFGAKVAIYDPFAKDIPDNIRVCQSLEELFSTCQVISIHCGLNDATRASVNAEMLALLPFGGVVVNTARGPIINEADLVEACKEKRIIAGVDVIEKERYWAQGDLATQTDTFLTGHVLTSGKVDRAVVGTAVKGLPDFVMHNLHVVRHGSGHLMNLISSDEYDIKT